MLRWQPKGTEMNFAGDGKVEILEVHAEGEVGQIVVSGAPNIGRDTSRSNELY